MAKELTSTIKPEGTEFKDQPKINIDKFWTARSETRKCFREKGIDIGLYQEHYMSSNDRLNRNTGVEILFSKADLEQEEIGQKVSTFIRLHGTEYYLDSKKREKSRIKEYLVYHVELSARDFLGNPLSGKLEFEGKALEPETRLKIVSDANGKQKAEYVFSRLRPKYYIEFSKATVDKILKQTGTDPNSVIYVAYIGNRMNPTVTEFRYNELTYQDFTEKTYAQVEAQARAPNIHWKNAEPKKEFVG